MTTTEIKTKSCSDFLVNLCVSFLPALKEALGGQAKQRVFYFIYLHICTYNIQDYINFPKQLSTNTTGINEFNYY